MTKKQIGVAILGGSGYGGGELLRLLAHHPLIDAVAVVSRTYANQPVASIHSHLQGISSLTFTDSLPPSWHEQFDSAAVICSMPPGQAAAAILATQSQALPDSVKFIDLSGDFRLKNPKAHTTYYPEVPLAPEIRSACVYALPEVVGHTSIAKARYLTNPGCLSTTTILGLAPLQNVPLHGQVVVDAKTGTSGAGREPQASMHHPARAHDFAAYKVLEHRHEPEIVQALGEDFQAKDNFMFVPHLLPVSRGIEVSCYFTCSDSATAAELPNRYRQFYSGSPFIRFRDHPPRLVDVVGTNFCDIHIVVRRTQVVVLLATDNLGKGMAGQCIQNLNIAFELPQETGLLLPALGPV